MICPQCNKSFVTEKGLALHKSFMHGIPGKRWNRRKVKTANKGADNVSLAEAVKALEVKRDSYNEVIAELRAML